MCSLSASPIAQLYSVIDSLSLMVNRVAHFRVSQASLMFVQVFFVRHMYMSCSSPAAGAGTSIIGILEVVESDFATGLAKEESQEDDAQALYDDLTQKNKVTKTMKDQDLKYKTAEVKSLAKTIADLSSDKETLSTELDAVNEYYAKLKDRCIAKPETYEERKARRTAEINGLKEALQILESETALVQRSSRRTHMRGALEAR